MKTKQKTFSIILGALWMMIQGAFSGTTNTVPWSDSFVTGHIKTSHLWAVQNQPVVV